MITTKNKILVLAPHTDDGEFGCGASIAKLVEEGKEVHYIAFSIAEQSVIEGFEKNVLEDEVKRATGKLGIPPSNLYVFRYEVRKLNYVRQELLEKLISIKNDICPDLVFIPSPNDLHQDHYTVAMEGMRAFKQTSVLGYELPWNNITFRTQAFAVLERKHIEQKIQALSQYKSQSHKFYSKPEFIMSLARTRGAQMATEFAESFEVIRWAI